MKKYFTIMLATVMTSLAVTSSAYANPCGDNDDECWDRFYGGGGTITPVNNGGGGTITPVSNGGGGGGGVSEPAALLVSLTALGLFVAARRRKSK